MFTTRWSSTDSWRTPRRESVAAHVSLQCSIQLLLLFDWGIVYVVSTIVLLKGIEQFIWDPARAASNPLEEKSVDIKALLS